MLDPASIERLAANPEKNDPLLNVALAEEGGADVLLTLARCTAVGPEALAIVAARVATEAEILVAGDDGERRPLALDLERELLAHPNTPAAERDAILERHHHEASFVALAAAHPHPTRTALDAAAAWPAASPLHDRPWLVLLRAAEKFAGLIEDWAGQGELFREAAARVSSDRDLLARLGSDKSRRVRRAVVSNPAAGALRTAASTTEPAVEVRARASRSDGGAVYHAHASLVASMERGGVLANDVKQALLLAGSKLDEEGAFLAARHLARADLPSLVAQVTADDQDPFSLAGAGVGAGLGLRSEGYEDSEAERAVLTSDIVHLVTRRGTHETRLTGKARAAHWIAECLHRSRVLSDVDLCQELAARTLASDRMVLFRWAARSRPSFLARLSDQTALPISLIELGWKDDSVPDELLVSLSSRVMQPLRADRDLPEDELDLAPMKRPLPVLERAVLAAIGRVPASPRAALAAIALDPRRCRYVLSAMPGWKDGLTGARLARVLRSHAGALSAALRSSLAPSSAKPAAVARWTDRKLNETEAAIAVAVGDLTAVELLVRLTAGAVVLENGITLAAGVEARAAIEGAAAFLPIAQFAATRRTKEASAFAIWVLLEELDRTRAPSLIASSIDGLLAGGSVAAAPVCEALAILERRSPGRLEAVYAQSPRGRATVASAIARAYRAFGGMRDET